LVLIHGNRKIELFFLALLSLLFLQSCTVFRTHIDDVCAAQYKDEYPQPKASRFSLPWKVGESYRLTQGNCTLESHNLAQKQHMSFDFKMPIGTAVHAIAAGRVAAVVENFKDGVDMADDQANLIGIEHERGVISWYMHLKYNGVTVEVDDKVLRGEVIGYSGNTGNSAYPHLHLYAQQLTAECHDQENKTARLNICPHLPLSFFNASPNDRILKEFVDYTAKPY